MNPKDDLSNVYPEAYGLRVSVPREGFTEGNLAVLRQMIESREYLIRKALGASSLDFIITKDQIQFPWFREIPEDKDIEHILVFISALCARAKSGRLAPQQKDYESEKYTFNRFLTALELDGPEYQEIRKKLMKNLSGSVPFPDKKAEMAHRDRTRLRRMEVQGKEDYFSIPHDSRYSKD